MNHSPIGNAARVVALIVGAVVVTGCATLLNTTRVSTEDQIATAVAEAMTKMPPPSSPTAPVRAPTYTPPPTYTPAPTYTALPTATPYPTYTRQPTRKAVPASATPTQAQRPQATTSYPIRIRVLEYSFESWGKPAGMGNPSEPCGYFDDRFPVTRLTAKLLVENTSDQNMNQWTALFQTADGRWLYRCYYGYDERKGVPVAPARQAIEVTWVAFMEKTDYSPVSAFLQDQFVGRSNTVAFPRP